MPGRFNNSLNTRSKAFAAESGFAYSSSDNNVIMLNSDTVGAVSVFVIIEHIIRVISIIILKFSDKRPFSVPTV